MIFAGHNLYFELKGNLTDSAVLNIGEAAEICSIVTCYLKACHKNNQQKRSPIQSRYCFDQADKGRRRAEKEKIVVSIDLFRVF